MGSSPLVRAPHSQQVGGTPWQLGEETSAWWRPEETAQSRSVCRAGGDAAWTPMRQRSLEISPEEEEDRDL